MRILVADDDRVVRRLLEGTLTRSGHDVVAVADGTEAWSVLSGQDPPGVAILDWMMPGLTGVEVCQRVRGIPSTTPTYLIVLTSKGRSDDVLAAFQAGVLVITRKCRILDGERGSRVPVACDDG